MFIVVHDDFPSLKLIKRRLCMYKYELILRYLFAHAHRVIVLLKFVRFFFELFYIFCVI